MDQMRIQLVDFSRNGQLCENLLSILKTGFKTDAEVTCSVIGDFISEETNFFRKLEDFRPDILLLVVNTTQVKLIRNLIPRIKSGKQPPEIILVTEGCGANEILDLMMLGASDFISLPITASSTLPRVRCLVEKSKSRVDSIQSIKARIGQRLLIGEAPIFLAEVKKIPLLASCDGRVLILGQTGTGKELFARAIHYLSPRMRHPFVAVSCGAIPVELVENEMFGHQKGAFTGAMSSELGLIGEAEGGTLFLDEVDCLPLLAQTKLLRFLQEAEYKPLGSSRPLHADVRVIAASNIDLAQAVKEKRLRQDLYYRLNVAQVRLPSLCERPTDIPLLAQHFLAKYAHEFDRKVRGLSEVAMRKLVFYDWPGNVRELENTIERAVMLTETDCIHDTDIVLPEAETCNENESFQEIKTKKVTQFERAYIERLMVTYQGNVSRAARAAKKNRRAFWALIRKHDVDVERFRPNLPISKRRDNQHPTM